MIKKLTPKIDTNLLLNSQTAMAIAIIGDRWVFLIIRNVFQGIRQFEPLLKKTGAARGTLTSRLKTLVQSGILYKNPYQLSPLRYEYRLTDKGLDLSQFLISVLAWDSKWVEKGNIPMLFHNNCGKPMKPKICCSHCNNPLTPHETSFTIGFDELIIKKNLPRSQRRYKNPDKSTENINVQSFCFVDILGDRWTSLIVAAALFGIQRFDDILSTIGISTNILANRLKLLIDVGVLKKHPYQERPIRHEYHLSEKGRDLFYIAVAMHEWANRWLLADTKQPMILRHDLCHRPLTSKIVCDCCNEILQWDHIAEKKLKK